jgi:hypothetical protein
LPDLVGTIPISAIPDLQASLAQIATPPKETLALMLWGGTISANPPVAAERNGSFASALFTPFATLFGWTLSAESVAPAAVAHVPAAFATVTANDPDVDHLVRQFLARAYVTALPRLKTNPCDDDTLFTVRAFLSAAYRADTGNGVAKAALREQYELDAKHRGWSTAEEAQLGTNSESVDALHVFLSNRVAAECPRADDLRLRFAHHNDPKLGQTLIYQDAALRLIEEAHQTKGRIDQAKLREAAGCVLKALELTQAPECSVPVRGMWIDAYLPALRTTVIQATEKQ